MAFPTVKVRKDEALESCSSYGYDIRIQTSLCAEGCTPHRSAGEAGRGELVVEFCFLFLIPGALLITWELQDGPSYRYRRKEKCASGERQLAVDVKY